MLTIDYGGTLPGLYERRPGGTLRGYAHHQRLGFPELYESPGLRDLTADVNFTDLQQWGAVLGLENAPLQTQAAFLRQWAPGLDRRSARDPAIRALLDPDGMGGAFKVLEQQPA